MTIKQSVEEFAIPQFRFNEEYLRSTRIYLNQVRGFEAAVARMDKRGSNVRRSSPKRSGSGTESDSESAT